MSNSKKTNNKKSVSKKESNDVVVFTNKTKYQEAISKENTKINNAENRIEELRKMLSNLEDSKKSSKSKISSKPKVVNGISTSQKHVVMKSSEVENYNYEKRLANWKKNAGYNEKSRKCSVCKDSCLTSILLDNNSHICYICWIKKPTNKNNQKKKK